MGIIVYRPYSAVDIAQSYCNTSVYKIPTIMNFRILPPAIVFRHQKRIPFGLLTCFQDIVSEAIQMSACIGCRVAPIGRVEVSRHKVCVDMPCLERRNEIVDMLNLVQG